MKRLLLGVSAMLWAAVVAAGLACSETEPDGEPAAQAAPERGEQEQELNGDAIWDSADRRIISGSGPDKVAYIVVPHPDDEMQAWSLIENTPDTYEVFIMLTRGEETAYCDSPGFDPGTGEARPDPWPVGKYTPSCEAARVNSFFDFIYEMAAGDDSLPESFTYEGVKGPFDSGGREVCRYDKDADAAACVADFTAQLWTSSLAAVVWFNLGDGDVTASEVRWAIETVRDNLASLGVDDEWASAGLIGASYWNGGFEGCHDYDHRDHGAVQEALRSTDFRLGLQAAPSCSTDPEVSLIKHVSYEHFDGAFATSGTTRVGAHPVHYGWLLDADYYRGDYEEQEAIFHRKQSFWVRFGEFEEAVEP